MNLAVGLLCAGAVFVLGLGPRRPGLSRPRRAVDVAGRVGVLARLAGVLGIGGGRDEARLQIVVTQAATLLRSGLPPDQAWESVGGIRTDGLGIPRLGDLVALVDPVGPPHARSRQHWRPARRKSVRADRAQLAQRQAYAIVAACRLAARVGAPLAVVLDSIVLTLVASAEAAADRDAALAGPQSTARVLLWLPVAGAALGTALGADPVGLLLGGGPLALVPATGIALMLLGRRWSARLVSRARAAGSPP